MSVQMPYSDAMTETEIIEDTLVGMFVEIEMEQGLVESTLDEFDATPNWRWFRKNRLLDRAIAHHKRSGELIDSARSFLDQAAKAVQS